MLTVGAPYLTYFGSGMCKYFFGFIFMKIQNAIRVCLTRISGKEGLLREREA
jgi:hypothetical protein